MHSHHVWGLRVAGEVPSLLSSFVLLFDHLQFQRVPFQPFQRFPCRGSLSHQRPGSFYNLLGCHPYDAQANRHHMFHLLLEDVRPCEECPLDYGAESP